MGIATKQQRKTYLIPLEQKVETVSWIYEASRQYFLWNSQNLQSCKTNNISNHKHTYLTSVINFVTFNSWYRYSSQQFTQSSRFIEGPVSFSNYRSGYWHWKVTHCAEHELANTRSHPLCYRVTERWRLLSHAQNTVRRPVFSQSMHSEYVVIESYLHQLLQLP